MPASNPYARQDSYDERTAQLPSMNYMPAPPHSPTYYSRGPPSYRSQPIQPTFPSNSARGPAPQVPDKRYSTRHAPIHRGATLRQRNNQPNLPPGAAHIPSHRNDYAGPSSNPSGAGLSSATTLRRGKTLTRPDRHVAPAPLINPSSHTKGASFSDSPPIGMQGNTGVSWFQPWSAFVICSTIWAPSFALSACGIKGKAVQRAWKEKVALCIIALILGGFVGFFSLGLQKTLCPASAQGSGDDSLRLGERGGYVGIFGSMFLANASVATGGVDLKTYAQALSGQDVSYLFDRSARDFFPSCRGQNGAYATTNLCLSNTSTSATQACQLQAPSAAYFKTLNIFNSTKAVGWSWDQVAEESWYMVMDGDVLNMTPYIAAHPNGVPNDPIDSAIRQVLYTQDKSYGKDATRLFHQSTTLEDARMCLRARYAAGKIDKITPGCFFSQLFLYVSLVVILGIILARFFMACVFSWFLSHRLVKPPKNLRRQVVSPAVMPEGANIEVNNKTGTAPWTSAMANKNNNKLTRRNPGPSYNEKTGSPTPGSPQAPLAVDADGMINMASIGAELFCVCLVTCYSEGEEGIRTTLDSIAATTYSDARKLLFVVCDGIVTGSGEKKSTPDICVGLVDRDERFGQGEPQRMSYLAVGSGKMAHNEALVYAGHYTQVPGHRTPIIVVVKVGGPEEAHAKKPGNRGKRDGQMILMNFFGRVTYNDRMCPLDYDLFRKTQALMGVTPDFFEVCLMVDADTKAFPDSLTALVNCMQHDPLIMGVCGETRIANKRQSWVTAIQVFEYFISHHLAKAFESVFGGVTCLPGCFSMYRIKARKANDSDWVPILSQSEITKEYSQSDVETLHQKNLLLLGEDRFLTTLLLRTFPNRKMMFCPQARCRTIAPDEFKILLSQRRRWINSTIHNLMELVRVRNLCGTFCFSMQFIVFMELVGTVVLPIAICLTFTLVINYIITPPANFGDAIPLLLLGGVLGLPGVLVMITSGKVVYIFWMLVYLLALPIWNFVLPVYAFWHFDDFSWGETRKVEGEVKDLGHGGTGGKTVEVAAVPFRRWEDWERSRLRKMKRDQRRKKDFERAFGTAQHHPPESLGSRESRGWDAETASLATTGEEDRYGYQIGHYQEDGVSNVPPPVGLYNVDDASSMVVKSDQMAAILDEEWEEDEDEDIANREMLASAVQYTPVVTSRSISPQPLRGYSLSDQQPRSLYSGLGVGSQPSVDDLSPFATGVQTRGLSHARSRSNGSQSPSSAEAFYEAK